MEQKQQQDAPSIAAAEEVCKTKGGIPSSSAAAEVQVNENHCLSGDMPFFDIILSKSHVTPPYSVILPSRAVINLPPGEARVVVTYAARKWNLFYNGSAKKPKFLYSAEWGKFVKDNNLKRDDACIFEVMESSPTTVELKLVILRNTKRFPSQLQAEVEPHGMTAETGSHGSTAETAIELD